MEGAQDMGGVWSGAVVPEPDEPIFHAEWERRAFAITLAMGMPGGWNIDMSRFAREDRSPLDYLSKSYYQIWLAGVERLMLERGLVAQDELIVGHMLHPAKASSPILASKDVTAVLRRGSPTERYTTTKPMFEVGERVRGLVVAVVGTLKLALRSSAVSSRDCVDTALERRVDRKSTQCSKSRS